MPTWRNNIVGQNISVQVSNTRTLNSAFMETDYARYWQALLHDQRLKGKPTAKVVAPHPNIRPYLEMKCPYLYKKSGWTA